MCADLNNLLQAQRDIHGRMSRSVENLRKLGAAGINLGSIEARIKILDQLWAKFETQHELIRTRFNNAASSPNMLSSTELLLLLRRSLTSSKIAIAR